MDVNLTKEQFEYWRHLPETQEILKIVNTYINELTDHLVSGATVGNPIETAEVVGKIHGLRFVIDIDYQ